VEVGFFGAWGVLFDADLVAVLVEEFFLCHRCFFPGLFMLYYGQVLGFY
jgi:hypothetical protein